MSSLVKHFLIIRLSSLGDVVLSTALIRCVKQAYPNSTIDFIVKQQFVDVLKYNPYIDNVFEYVPKDKHSIHKIRDSFNKDYFIIDLQNNLISRKIRHNIGLQTVKFDKKLLHKLVLVYLKKNLFDNTTIPERYITTAEVLNIKNDNKGLEVWLPDEKHYQAQNKLIEDKIVVSIAPSATHKTKQWLPDYFVELIHKINEHYNCKFNLLGGIDSIELCKYIIENLQKSTTQTNLQIENLSGKTSILDVASILQQSHILVSNDTGILHIGAARSVPTVAIYGSTTTALGFAPYKTLNRICEVQLKCRPCSHIGRRNCPKKHFNCMKLLNTEIVFNSFQELVDTY